MQKCVALTIIALILLPLVGADTAPPDESREAIGGHSILLEQYTATWCDTCATIDPWISDFVDDRHSRVVRVALHPLGPDPFGTNLTTHRVYLNGESGDVPLPTFWFDGGGQQEGQVTQSTLENGLRNAEGNRESEISMHVWWDTWNNEPHDTIQILSIHIEGVPDNANMTVFRLENLEMTDEIAYNGIDVHHDVATQMIAFDQNGTVSQSFDGDYGWTISKGNLYSEGGIPVFILETHGDVDGFVTVIEVEGAVRGVIEITAEDNPRNVEKNDKIALILLLGALVASSTLVSRRQIQ